MDPGIKNQSNPSEYIKKFKVLQQNSTSHLWVHRKLEIQSNRMKFIPIVLLAMAGVCMGVHGGIVQRIIAPPTVYSTVTGYQTTIYKPPLPALPASILPQILPPQAPLVIQHPRPIAQFPFVQFPQHVAPVAIAQPQPIPQPVVPVPIAQPQPVAPVPIAQPQPVAPVPIAQPAQPQPIPAIPQPGNGPPPAVVSDQGDTVEIDNPELRSANPALPYQAPISAYPFYATG